MGIFMMNVLLFIANAPFFKEFPSISPAPHMLHMCSRSRLGISLSIGVPLAQQCVQMCNFS